MHIAHVIRIHAEDAGDSAEREKDDGHDRKDVDSRFLAVLVGVDFLYVLQSVCQRSDKSRAARES